MDLADGVLNLESYHCMHAWLGLGRRFELHLLVKGSDSIPLTVYTFFCIIECECTMIMLRYESF